MGAPGEDLIMERDPAVIAATWAFSVIARLSAMHGESPVLLDPVSPRRQPWPTKLIVCKVTRLPPARFTIGNEVLAVLSATLSLSHAALVMCA